MPFNPLLLLREASKKVPAMKYAFGIVGIAAVIAIIKGLGIKNSSIPIGTILLVFGLMILVFVFSVLVKNKNKSIQNAGIILLYGVVLLAVLSGGLLISSIFFDFPKPINQIGIFRQVEKSKSDTTVKDQDKVIKTENNSPSDTATHSSATTPVVLTETDHPFKEFTLTAGQQHVMNDLQITLTLPSQFPVTTTDINIKAVKIRIWRNIIQPLSDTAVLDPSGSQPGVEVHLFTLNAITPVAITNVGQFKFYLYNPVYVGKRVASVQVKMYRN